jgi:hypothetical protein
MQTHENPYLHSSPLRLSVQQLVFQIVDVLGLVGDLSAAHLVLTEAAPQGV